MINYKRFVPLHKGSAEKVLAMLKGGGTKSFGVVLTQPLNVLAMLKVGCNKSSLSERGNNKSFNLY